MAHYAFLDENNIVTEVIVGRDEDDLVDGITSWEQYYGSLRGQACLRTSYNTIAGVHLNGGVPFRGNYAGVGFKYRKHLDAFVAQKPFSSWVLNESTYTWEAPIPMPGDGDYTWNEGTQSWDPVSEA